MPFLSEESLSRLSRCLDEEVCVVSIIGKSRLTSNGSKAWSIVRSLGQDGDAQRGQRSASDCPIEVYMDSSNKVLYLHLVSCLDSNHLLALVSSGENVADLWQREERIHTRRVLFLFLVSHVVVVCHPSSQFDMSYVRLFRTLDTLRHNVHPRVVDLSKSVSASLSSDWVYAGRFCTPRVLFCFEGCPLELKPSEERRNEKKTEHPTLKKLQSSLSEQIYRMLRKSYVITNNCNEKLLALPADDEFVFIHTACCPSEDLLSVFLRQMASGPAARTGSDAAAESASAFQSFLLRHVHRALAEGFHDSVGKNPVRAVFEVPLLRVWLEYAHALFSLLEEVVGDKLLCPLVALDEKLSAKLGERALPNALSAYKDGLPPLYTRQLHLARMDEAQRVLSLQVRGPSLPDLLVRLEQACTRHWADGRQMCEQRSLTGSACVLELHGDERRHNSKAVRISASDSGWKQAERSDPFALREANWAFYDDLADDDTLSQRVPFEEGHGEASAAGMMHADLPPGSVLAHPSWALLRLSDSAMATRGLDQPGFLSGMHLLHAWEVRKGVLAHVGVEYECPRGHRFLSADRRTDVPLYSACPCRKERPLLAQLMRLFVHSPEPLLLHPRVQPCPGWALFWPHVPLPWELAEKTLFVLRLPCVYATAEGVAVCPEGKALSECKLLKGWLTVPSARPKGGL